MSNICDDLRAAILQAAMQGKLTKQLSEDGDAEDLLEEIKAEKEKLIAEGKIKKQITLPKITDSEKTLSIPDNWAYIRLEDIGYFVSGKTPSRHQLSSSGKIPYFKVSDMNTDGNEKYLSITTNYLNDNYHGATFKKDTIVYPKNGGAVFTNKKRILRQESLVDLNTGGFCSLSILINIEYLYMIFSSIDFRQHFKGTALPTINMDSVRKIVLPLPPLAEQKRIVKKVDELMARVADLEQSADALASLKKAFPDDIKASLLQYAMQGKLTKQLPEDGNAEDLLERIKAEKEKLIAEGKIKKQKPLAPITDDEIPFSIPENWKWVRLGDLTTLISDGTHRTPKYVDNGIPFLSVQNISKGYFDFTKIKFITEKEHAELTKRIKPTIDDILICRIGTLGKALKNTLDYEFSIFVSLGVVRLVEVSLADYVIEVINSPVGFKWIQENKVGGGTHTYKINLSDLPNMLIPLPPLAEQKRISERLNTFMCNINTVGELIASE